MTGLEINMLNTYTSFAKRGWNVIVYTTRDTKDKKNSLPKKDFINGIQIMRSDSNKFKFDLLSITNHLGKDDIVCFHDYAVEDFTLFLLKTLLLKLLKRKQFTLIFSSHGLFNHSIKAYPNVRSVVRKIFERTVGIVLLNSVVDGIRTVSTIESNGLVQAGIKKEKITTVTNGLEVEAFENTNLNTSNHVRKIVKENKKYILQVGRIDRIKNLEIVVKALPSIDHDVNFLVIGKITDHGYKKDLDRLVAQLHLKRRVKFIGDYYGTDKYYLIKNATILTQLSFSEAFGNAVHEALSQGVVCIVSKNTALELLVKDGVNGFCINQNDNLKLIEKVNYILNPVNLDKIKKIKKANRKEYLDISWEEVAKKVENLYLKIQRDIPMIKKKHFN